MTATQSDFKIIRDEVAQIRLQVGLAEATSDEALAKVSELEDQVADLQAKSVSTEQVADMIKSAIAEYANTVRPSVSQGGRSGGGRNDTVASDYRQTDDANEKFQRTLVIGGFEPDTEKKVVVEFIKQKILKSQDAVEEVYAYTFGSVGFVRFKSEDEMWKLVKETNEAPKVRYGSKEIWISTSKSPEERRKAKVLGKYKRVFIEVGMATPENVKINYKWGIIYVNKIRIGTWKSMGAEDDVEIAEDKLKALGMGVGVDMLKNAVKELMQE